MRHLYILEDARIALVRSQPVESGTITARLVHLAFVPAIEVLADRVVAMGGHLDSSSQDSVQCQNQMQRAGILGACRQV
jgi:hypothetical protein